MQFSSVTSNFVYKCLLEHEKSFTFIYLGNLRKKANQEIILKGKEMLSNKKILNKK